MIQGLGLPFCNKKEKIILQNVDSKFKYIARDMLGDLNVYVSEPDKGNTMWLNSDMTDYVEMIAFNHLFKNISWEDDEPTLISEVLNG